MVFKDIEKYFEGIENRLKTSDLSSRREFLIVGRSNVGKSTLLNEIFNRQLAQISRKPGKTRDLSFYRLDKEQEIVLVDAPGYGFAGGNKKELDSWSKLLSSYMIKSQFLHRVLVLIDYEHGFKDLDSMLFKFLESQNQPFMVVLTKIDKVKHSDKEVFDSLTENLQKYRFCSPIVHVTSAKDGVGITELRQNICFLMNDQKLRKLKEAKM